MSSTLLSQDISVSADGASVVFTGTRFDVADVSVDVSALPQTADPADIPVTFVLERQGADGTWYTLNTIGTAEAAGELTLTAPLTGRVSQDQTVALRISYTISAAIDSGTLDATFTVTGRP